MSQESSLSTILTNEFDYNIISNQLKQYRFPRNKIGSLLKSGTLVRVKKGLYVKAGSAFSPAVLANMIYGPSYVSQDYALSLYALIPERVHIVTSMTLGRKKRFETPIGTFTYEPLPAHLYALGFRRTELTPTQAYLIATPEKAIVDIIWRRTDLETAKVLEEFLIDDRRIDLEDAKIFSITRMRELERAYKRPVVTALADLIARRIRR